MSDVIHPNEAITELDKIEKKLDEVKQKSYKWYQRGKKRTDIRNLVNLLDIVLHSADPDYEKGDIIEKAPQPTTLRGSFFGGDVVDQQIEASPNKWLEYLQNQLDIYRKRFELLAKNPTVNNIQSEKASKQSNQVFEKVENYFNYNPVVNITTINQHIDQIILELDNEVDLDPETKEKIKSKLQKAKEFIKNAADEASPMAGKFVGKALRSFLFGTDID